MNNETNYCGERKSCQKGDCKGCLLRGIEEPKLGEECGVFGMYDLDGNDVASSIYYGLFALQHRGQESCGIAVSRTDGPPRNSNVCKGMGLVNEVFNAENLEKMAGDIGVGHVRYSTAGASVAENTQPLVLNYIKGTLSMAHNGNLVNSAELRESCKNPIVSCTIESGYPSWKRRRHISPSVRSCTFKRFSARSCARRLKRSKSSLSVLSSKTAPSQTPYFSNSPLYKRKAKSSSVKTLHFLLSRDSTRSIRIYSPFS